jgi:two-component system, OmpR family, sensor histidine kinase KdpD
MDADRGQVETLRSFQRKWLTPITVSLLLVGLTTVLLWPFDAQLNHHHLIFIYLMPASLVAIRYGSISAMCVTIASSLAATYFLYAPRFSFQIANPLDVLELVLFCLLALLASQVVSGFANDDEVARRRRQPAVMPRRRPTASTVLNCLRFR